MKSIRKYTFFLFVFYGLGLYCQDWDGQINNKLADIIREHKDFVSIPNLPENEELMLENITWVKNNFEALGFKSELLESSTLPLLLIEKIINPNLKTILFYFHIDGQPVDPRKWNQDDPFIPVLKKNDTRGKWTQIKWSSIDNTIDEEWRIFARAVADDKGPITMLLNALRILEENDIAPSFNIKIIFDPEEEYGSDAFLSTLEAYKNRYKADAMIIMDGPAHESNKPTLTFGCRGIATCSITTYGSVLPEHSGHYGNYVPNPVFSLATILSSMKDGNGKVLIKDYYSGIEISADNRAILDAVPDNKIALNKRLQIAQEESVGNSYQESLQYPSLNVRQIETSWKGDKPKTVIPEFAKANIDVRLVVETDGKVQLEKIKSHIIGLGYTVLDHEPSTKERMDYARIVTFESNPGVNAFRTDLDSDLGTALRHSLTTMFNEEPVSIRTMGGTVPIISAIRILNIPAIIVPTVNMDNNQHNPNENIRLGNIKDGIKTCIAILQTQL